LCVQLKRTIIQFALLLIPQIEIANTQLLWYSDFGSI
jgi:hypothetical protein